MRIARDQLGLTLETTYTGKAMAALLADIQTFENEQPRILFWNTYNSVPLAADVEPPFAHGALPEEFMTYFS